MSEAAGLFVRLDHAVRQAAAAGEIGTARSLRLHVGAPSDDLPEIEAMLALADAIFGCGRGRIERSGDALLGMWEHGQVATISRAPSPRPLAVLTVLGSVGALHFEQGGT